MIPERPRRLLDPVYAAWLEATNPPLPAGFRPTLEEMRDGFRRQAAISNGELDASLVVEDIDLPGRDGRAVPARVYRHRDAAEPRAVLRVPARRRLGARRSGHPRGRLQ